MNNNINIISLSGRIGSGKDTVGKIIRNLTSPSREIPNYVKWTEFGMMSITVETPSPWQIKKFAEKLKQVASLITGVPIERFEDQEFKKLKMGPEWKAYYVYSQRNMGRIGLPYTTEAEVREIIRKNSVSLEDIWTVCEDTMTYREFLQLLGTEAGRNILHPNIWVNSLFADYKRTRIGGTLFEKGICVGSCEDEWPFWIITDTRFENEAEAVSSRGGMMVKVQRSQVSTTDLHPSETSLDDYKFDYIIDNSNGTIEELIPKVETMLKYFGVCK